MGRNNRRDFYAIGVDVILHHHLKTEGHVIEECDQQQHHQHGSKRRAEPQDESTVVASSTRDQRGSEPKSLAAPTPPQLRAAPTNAQRPPERSRGLAYGRMTIAFAFQPSIYPFIPKLMIQAVKVRPILMATTAQPET